jgi:TolB-like protein
MCLDRRSRRSDAVDSLSSCVDMSTSADRGASIAVAPIREAPADPDHARLAAGFLEDVTAELARFPTFEVLAATTVLALSREELEPARLAERFGVTHLLDSTVQPTADVLRVVANLVEAPSGRHLWSQRYEVPLRDVFAVRDDVAAHVANHLNARIERARLSLARTRPITSLAAYDCWLRGRDCLRRGSVAADAEARELFERALAIDPTYARGYAGLSLSHFNEWSCQLWTAWEESERLAFEYALTAAELDDTDHVIHSVLGRIHVYRRSFGQARHLLDRALALSPNDADTLAQLAPWMGYLGEPERGVALAARAFRLNPLHDPSYYVFGGLPHFFTRELEAAVSLLERAPPDLIVDQSAFIAACLAHLGRPAEAARHVAGFLATFQAKITLGRAPERDEPLAYLLHVNPFSRQADADFLVEGLHKAGLRAERGDGGAYLPRTARDEGEFRVAIGTSDRHLRYAGRVARVRDSKGSGDLARLLASPGERVHCMELLGRAAEGDAGAVLDARGRAACQRKMRALAEEIDDASAANDLGRERAAREALDELTSELAAALGLGGRARKLGDPSEKSRTAVTWRIRSAIRKIAQVHPELGRHLEVSVRTGTFCVYTPERPTVWAV